MKKFTLPILLLLIGWNSARAQCINEDQQPFEVISAENSGLFEEIANCNFTMEFAQVAGLITGATYQFSCKTETMDVHKYITITDTENNVLATGPSPLTFEQITASEVRVHFSENDSCETNDACHSTGFQLMLDCPFPTAISISGLSSTSASLSWSNIADENAWRIWIGPAENGAPGNEELGELVEIPEYTASDLEPGTSYTVFLRSVCGEETGPWSTAFSFSTHCTSMAVFSEDFDQNLSIPDCWQTLMRGDIGFAQVSIMEWGSVHSPPYYLEMNLGDADLDADVLLISPPLTNLGAGTHRIKFWMKGTAGVEVGTIDTTTDAAVFSVIETINATNTAQEFTVNFDGSGGTDPFIAFRVNSTASFQFIQLDDIRYEPIPSCPDVTEVIVDAITNQSFSLNWNPGGTESTWEVAYAPSPAEDIQDATSITVEENPVVTISSLQPDTSYTYWLRSVCSQADPGAWIGPFHVATDCNAIESFLDDLEDTTENDLSPCWNRIINGPDVSDSANVRVVSWAETSSGSHSIMMSANDSDLETANIMLIAPNLSTLTSASHRLKFNARGFDAGLEIGTLDGLHPGSNFTLFQDLVLSEDMEQHVVNFDSFSGSDTYLAIRLTGGVYAEAFLDDLRWEPIPECADVTHVVVSSTQPESASFSWLVDEGTGFEAVVTAADSLDPLSGTLLETDQPSISVAGLNTSTAYHFWVRSVCGSMPGAWIGPLLFRTDCNAVNNFMEDFSDAQTPDLPNCWNQIIRGSAADGSLETVQWGPVASEPVSLYMTNGDADTTDNDIILVSPRLGNLSAGSHRIKFSAMSQTWDNVEIGTLDTNTPSAVFTPIETIALSEEMEDFSVSLEEYEGTDLYLGIRLVAANTWSACFFDDIRWEPAPECPDVSALSSSNIGLDTAEVSWNGAGDGDLWQVVWSEDQDANPDNLTAGEAEEMTYTITGLLADTVYFYWVRSVCGGTALGAWSGSKSFKTHCPISQLPFLEDFETSEVDQAPACGTLFNAGNGNDWTIWDWPGNGFESKTLVYNYFESEEADAWYFTRGIALEAGTSYTLSYRFGNNDTDYIERLRVSYGQAPKVEDMLTELADHSEITGGEPQENSLNFIAPTTGVYYFGFQAYSQPEQWSLYLDDIALAPSLDVSAPQQTHVRIYPNPTAGILHIESATAIRSIRVMNLLGQELIHKEQDGLQNIDLSGLAAGSYLIRVRTEMGETTLKTIKR